MTYGVTEFCGSPTRTKSRRFISTQTSPKIKKKVDLSQLFGQIPWGSQLLTWKPSTIQFFFSRSMSCHAPSLRVMFPLCMETLFSLRPRQWNFLVCIGTYATFMLHQLSYQLLNIISTQGFASVRVHIRYSIFFFPLR